MRGWNSYKSATLALGVSAALQAAPAAASTKAQTLLAQLLLADDIAAFCPHVVKRPDDRPRGDFVQDGLLRIINENDVTMIDLMAVREQVSRARMHQLKTDELVRQGIDLDNRQEVCFFAQQIAGGTHPIGRYLEAR